jgi:predicted RNase H-like nuclease
MPWAGVDGCKRGWVAVVGEKPALRVYDSFAALLADLPGAVIAVDMPIGLPDRIVGGGRTPEKLVRAMLGPRQSSVFAIPARPVVEMGAAMTGRTGDDYPLHRRASALAKTLSDPPKGVSIQGFYLFPKILEIDALLRADPSLCARVKESHPEVAFTVLNGGQAMALPKKIKGKVNEAGMEERRALLARHGLAAPFLTEAPPAGVGQDDVLDAAVCWLVARRIASGQAVCFPDPPERDDHGLEVAIWA